ncbi:MAG: hypothetical protein ACM31C_11480 [Acidobacteriota bacterium]
MRLLAAALVIASAPALAGPQLAPVTSDNYTIDLYDGVSLGNSAVIAMGGATVANAIGSSGTLANPSAAAVRQTTDTDHLNGDYHLDALYAAGSKDFANSGLSNIQQSGARMITAGLSGRMGNWAGALGASAEIVPMPMMPGSTMAVDAQTLRARLAIAHWIDSRDIAVGVAAELAQLAVQPECTGCRSLFTINGIGLLAGATYIPRHQSFRLGAAANAPFTGGNVAVGDCDPMSCQGYVLPKAVTVPWRVAVGGVYRWAETDWNHLVGGDFRDEPAVTVVADLAVTGASPDAYGLEAAFGSPQQLERSGRHVAWSPRAGAEYEWLPGRLRVRGGSYWEPVRAPASGWQRVLGAEQELETDPIPLLHAPGIHAVLGVGYTLDERPRRTWRLYGMTRFRP